MLYNYLKIAWRSLRRNATYTVVNSFGLALGFAVALLVLLFVGDEWQHDAFHAHGNRLYRIIGHHTETGGTPSRSVETDAPLAPLLTQHVTAVKHAVRLSKRTLRDE